MGGDSSGQRHRFASGCKKKIHTPGRRVGNWTSRRSAGSTENSRVAGHPDTLTLEPGSARGQPRLHLTPRSKGDRPPGEGEERRGSSSSGPGRRRGHGPSYLCRPRARRRLWSRQSSRNVAPASEEFRTVRYLLKAAMAQPARARQGRDRGGGRSSDYRSAGSARETGRRGARGGRAVPTAQARPLARAAAPAALRSPPRTLARRERARAPQGPEQTRSAHAPTLLGSPGTRAQRRPWGSICRCWLLTIRLCIPRSHPYPHLRARTHTRLSQELEKRAWAASGACWDSPLRLHCWAVTILLKEPGRGGPALSQNLYTKQRAQ